jgi:subtilisin family serine protease
MTAFYDHSTGSISDISPSVHQQIAEFSRVSTQPNALRWQPDFYQSTGQGIRIALLDSGLDWLHPSLAGSDLQAKNFTGSGLLADSTGHGTQMAALLVGRGGLVPDAKLLFGKVFKGSPSAHTEYFLAKGIRWAIGQQVDILALPLGRSRPSRAVAQSIEMALANGIRIFAAAGNRGADRLLFPASLPGVMAITGADIRGQKLPECTDFETADWITLGQVTSLLSPTNSTEGRPAEVLTGSSPATVIAAAIASLALSIARGS